MKILVVCQHYYPEPFRVTDICEEFAKRGHDVLVVTGEPNYPEGYIYPGYEKHKKSDEIINGVRVHRCPIIPRKKGIIHRFLNYWSFARSSKKFVKSSRCVASDKTGFDIVFANQSSPVMMAQAAITYKKKYGVPVYLYCLDIWPECLVAGGVKRNSALFRHYYKVSKKIYGQADRIFVSSSMFSEYFKDTFGICNTVYLPQYSEELFTPEMCKKEPGETVDLMFAGNVGKMQSVETIVEAARLTRDVGNLRWHVVGDGSELNRMKALANGLNNVVFHGRKPLEDMPGFYRMADAMLVTMKKEPIIAYTLPGKVQTYMAAGKPILGAADGEVKRVITNSKCGYCADADDAEGLADLARKFVRQKSDHDEMGKNAARFYEASFTKARFFQSLEENWRA